MTNTYLRISVLSLCAIALGACACPRTPSHTGTPYGDERTAGQGAGVENDGYCLHRATGLK